MIPTRADVDGLVRALNGDTAVAAGALYTAAFIPPFLNIAYQELFSRLKLEGADRVQAYGYYLLPAYTNIFVPSLAGLTNFGGPVKIWERGSATSYAISAATSATPAAGSLRLTVAALPAAIVTGTLVDIYGVLGISAEVNDSWLLTVQSTTSVDLNGCASTGTYTSGGKLIYSTEEWSTALTPYSEDSSFPTKSAGSQLSMYSWARNAVRFPICSGARELKVLFELSSSLVTSGYAVGDSMGVDDSLAFLAARTAQLCAAAKGNKSKEASNRVIADTALALLLSNEAREQQMGEPVVPPPFRYRNRGISSW